MIFMQDVHKLAVIWSHIVNIVSFWSTKIHSNSLSHTLMLNYLFCIVYQVIPNASCFETDNNTLHHRSGDIAFTDL